LDDVSFEYPETIEADGTVVSAGKAVLRGVALSFSRAAKGRS
jgi:hypothetical protein